jgi:hypothetical protein
VQDVVEVAVAEELVVEHLVVEREGIENQRLELELLSLFSPDRFGREAAQEELEQFSEALSHGQN